jgi:hypothetical protein
MSNNDAELTDFDRMVLKEYPYPIAVGYRRVFDTEDWKEKFEQIIKVFDFGMRTVALGLIGQYVVRDVGTASNDPLNKLILDKLPLATLGSWKNIFFTALRAYEDKRHLFFIKELYDLYWDTPHKEGKPRTKQEVPYNRLIELRNDHIGHEYGAVADEEWEAVALEALACLRAVFQQFTFLAEYDLIHVIDKTENGYSYVIYTGEHPTPSAQPLAASVQLTPGYLYLWRGGDALLLLHPLFLFWSLDAQLPQKSDEHAMALSYLSSDAAIYSSFTDTTVTYLAAALQKTIRKTKKEDPELVGGFLRELRDRIQEFVQQQQEAKRFTWPLLREIALKVSEEAFGDVRFKYRKDLYLQRLDVKEQFDSFLASNKVAFLLLGKSGVGKSSFFLSMADEYKADPQLSDHVCLLLYDGATLESDKPLTQTIGADFGRYLRLEKGERIEDFVRAVSSIKGIEQHQVILFIDAINENGDPRNLLDKIDKLVRSIASGYASVGNRVASASAEANEQTHSEYQEDISSAETQDRGGRWLKVVISSRPEAWKTIKRGIRLAEHLYYTGEGQQEIGVELQPFTIGIEMRDFTRAELPDVYEKYRQAYHLQTRYEDISVELRKLLNDPLTLKLVAETYASQEGVIPRTVTPGEIYQKYIDQLINSNPPRLTLGDLRFLNEELMPLMLSQDHYDNKITADQVSSAPESQGVPLVERIFGEEQRSDGKFLNQAFLDLANADILLSRGSPTAYEISFKYERFYDFFAGKRLYNIASSAADRYKFFLEMIKQTGR